MIAQLPAGFESVAPDNFVNEGRQVNLLKVVWKRRLIVFLSVFLTLGGAVVYLLKTTPYYTSTSRIYVEQNAPRILDNDGSGNTKQSDGYLYTQAELMASQPILQAALETKGVKEAKVFNSVDNKVVQLKKGLDVTVGKKDEIISCAFNSPDPVECANIVNAVVNAYLDFQSKHKQNTAAEVLRILEKEKIQAEGEYTRQSDAMVAFKQANPDVFYETDKGNIVMQDLAQMSADLARARVFARAAESDFKTNDNKLVTAKNLENARRVLADYQQNYDAQQEKASAINAKQAQFQRLQADLTRTTALLDTLETRIKQVNVNEEGGPLNINVLEVARPEDKPTYPRRSLTLAVAGMLGLMLGVGGALARDWMDQRIQSADEVSELLGLSVLGIVPAMVGTKRTGVLGRRVELDPMSDISESFRSLRTALYFGTPDRSKKKVLITSPSPGDGKSTSASNLAIVLAQAGQRTLLIDADMRRPTQHKVFSLDNETGLSDAIIGKVQAQEVLHRTSVDGLSVLTSGPIPPNPSELLNSAAFMELIDRLAAQYDQIIIDSPPVLAVTDARILGALCDITILVLRAEKSTRKGSEHAVERLQNVGARILGAVVNDVPRGHGSAYYAGYEQYHGYTHPDKPGLVVEHKKVARIAAE